MTKRKPLESAFGPMIAWMSIPWSHKLMLTTLKHHTGWGDRELFVMLPQLGLPETREEQSELMNLCQFGPMQTERYYLWAAAIRDAQSRWSLTLAGGAALRTETTHASWGRV